MSDKTPFDLGYAMPAEWEPHDATWLAWPKNTYSFPGDTLQEVERTYVRIIEEISAGEKVELLVDSEGQEEKARKMLSDSRVVAGNVFFHRIPTGDIWFRDFGPIFIKRKDIRRNDVAYTHWLFNAWGNKYDDIKQDVHVPEKMPLRQFKGFNVPMVLEGGSIDTNGLGTFLTTEQCLLNKNRNPELSRGRIEGYLRSYLGATNVIWLKDGLEGDDTDGHIDDIARFVSRDVVVCAFEDDAGDENYNALKANFDIINKAQDQDGMELKVARLPMPGRIEYEGRRLPASYANFYIANSAVLVPVFGDANDSRALDMLGRLFPTREVVGIDCRAMVVGFGTIHCATQQQPA